MKQILFITALLLSTGLSAQTEVSVYASDKSQSEGITYMLPKNQITVIATAVKSTYTPGQYHKFAEQHLRLSDINPEPSVNWELTHLTAFCSPIPDPDKMYYIKVNERSSAPLVQLTADGILLSVNDLVEYTPFRPEIPADKIEKDELNPQNYFTEDIIRAASSSATARLIAEEIYLIREKRNDLTRGELDNMPKDGTSMQLMLQQLNEQEEALASLFKGATIRETKQFVFMIIPEGDVNEEVLFRFSQKLGVIDPDNLAGAPYYFSIKSQQTVPGKEPETEADHKRIEKAEKDAQKRAMKGEPYLMEGIVYNVPERVDFSLYTPRKVYISQEYKIAQMGNTDVLLNELFNKKSTFHVTFNPEDGSINKVWRD